MVIELFHRFQKETAERYQEIINNLERIIQHYIKRNMIVID